MLLIDVSRYRRIVLFILTVLLMSGVIMVFYKSFEVEVNTFVLEVQYKEYSGLKGTFKYKLPEGWKSVEQKFEGGEIIYHNDFDSEDKSMHGYIQVWNLNRPLINFIMEGRKSAVGIISFKNYTIEPIKINGKEAYLLTYSRKDDNNKYIKGFEVFILQNTTDFSRFAFYMDEHLWKDEYRHFFLDIAATAQFK